MTLEKVRTKRIGEILADDDIHPGETQSIYRSRLREAGWVKSDNFDYWFDQWMPFVGMCPLLESEDNDLKVPMEAK